MKFLHFFHLNGSDSAVYGEVGQPLVLMAPKKDPVQEALEKAKKRKAEVETRWGSRFIES